MKHVIREIQPYRNFNESPAVQVAKVRSGAAFIAGKCTYHDAYNCSLFLSDAMLSYVVSGEKYMLIDKKEYYLKSGDMLYIPPNSVVFTDIPQGSAPFQSFNIRLPAEMLLRRFTTKKLCGFSFLVRPDKPLTDRIHHFLAAGDLPDTAFDALFPEILEQLGSRLFVPDDAGRTVSDAERAAIGSAVLRHLYMPVDLPHLACNSHMSLATFKRKFTCLFGLPPKTWIRHVRLQAAYFHLKTNRTSVSETSFFVGFENFAHFSHAFKQYFHMKPSALY